MNAACSPEFGEEAPRLAARMRDLEERARRIEAMVLQDEPMISVLISLCRLRQDIRDFEIHAAKARLRQMFGSLRGGEALPAATMAEVISLLRRGLPASRGRRTL